MPHRFRSRRSGHWPARPASRSRTGGPGSAGAATANPPAQPDGGAARADDPLSPLAGLRATLNAFCYFFAADPGDSLRRP